MNSFLCHGYSITLKRPWAIIPLLKIIKVKIAQYKNFSLFLIMKNNKKIKTKPIGEKINGSNLLNKYVLKNAAIINYT